jgi:nucleotide-binding universal stress UspA family protein
LGEEIWPNTPPKRILLATDLSGRGDRALDRAVQLANQWAAELLIVHALEGEGLASTEHQGLPSWRRPPNSVALVEDQIRDDVRGDCPRLKIHVEEGPAIKAILDAVERERCDLVIVGLGRYRSFGWPPLGKTLDELFRRAPVSVLVVKKRPRGPYSHLLVGADFTPEAQVGLETAVQLFPDAAVALMHAFEMPYRALLLDSQLARDFGDMERASLRAFADEAQLSDAARARLVTLIEHGPPELMLSTYVIEQGADLTVIGAYERSRIFHAMIVGKGPRILEIVPSDVLVVRAQRDPAAPE